MRASSQRRYHGFVERCLRAASRGFLLLVTTALPAVEIRVPGDHATIQPAIDAAEDGDVVLVAAGRYELSEPLTFRGKNIALRSVSGPESTMITAVEPTDAQHLVLFENGETRQAVLEGFTLAGARKDNFTYAIQCVSASPTIRGNVITANRSGMFLRATEALVEENVFTANEGMSFGAGIASDEGTPHIVRNVIHSNRATSAGGGIACYDGSTAIVERNVIHDNDGGESGGGVYVESATAPVFVHNTLVRNRADSGGGILSNGDAVIKNCILWDNRDAEGPNDIDGIAPPAISYCDIGDASFCGISGNICRNPQFIDDNGDFRLERSSPCVDAGDPDSPADPDGSRADIGALPVGSDVPPGPVATRNGDVDGDTLRDASDAIYLLTHFFLGGPPPVPLARAVGLPVTGQTTCATETEDVVEEIECPAPGEPFFGQDANYRAGISRRFEVRKPDANDDATWVTIDRSTGLMWQYRPANGLREDALAQSEGLVLAGHDDWTLPDVTELHSLVDWQSGGFPESDLGGSQGAYWSSTPYTDDDQVVVGFGGHDGQHGQFIGFLPTDNRASFRAVRRVEIRNGDVNGDEVLDLSDPIHLLWFLFIDGTAAPVERRELPATGESCLASDRDCHGVLRDFEVAAPEPDDRSTWYTIDHVTGLMWQFAGDGVPRSWKDALAYCEALELGGFDDWRMPNVVEQQSIFRYEPCCNYENHFPGGFDLESYGPEGSDYYEFWVSTHFRGAPLSFDYFSVFLMEATSRPHWVRAVRAIQPGDLAGR